jgi:hypothetical protein
MRGQKKPVHTDIDILFEVDKNAVSTETISESERKESGDRRERREEEERETRERSCFFTD